MFFQQFESIIVWCTLGFVALFWHESKKPLWKTILFTVWVILVFYINIPLFLTVVDGTKIKYSYIHTVFAWYAEYGFWYILFGEAMLAALGVFLGNTGSEQNNYDSGQVQEKFDKFILNATEVKIIGRDLDFLLDENYDGQKVIIEKLKDKAQLLCEHTTDMKLIELYHRLLEKGVRVRSYSTREGIANLKGQIKINDRNESSGIFVIKSTEPPSGFLNNLLKRVIKLKVFQLTEMRSSYLLDSVSRHFDETFSNSLNPVIKYIALDLGGVYFDGNIDSFYNYLQANHNITIKPDKKDRLNIDDDFVLGNIDIKELINKKATTRNKVNKLKDPDWEKIYNEWQHTWKPNKQMKKLMEDLYSLGYEIIPFSNLDRQNGDKYLRDSYLPKCCKRFYLSYDRGKCKPYEECFKDFEDFIGDSADIEGYQILIIDDEPDNLLIAKSLGWESICYNSNLEKIEKLIEEMKKIGVLPQSYELPNDED